MDASKDKVSKKTSIEKPKKQVSKKKKEPPRILVLIAVAVVVAAAWFFLIKSDSGTTATVGSAKLAQIQTYLSKGGSDADKKAQTVFTQGNPIQVGFMYDGASEEADSAVRFVVRTNDAGEEVFTTNLFKLNPVETELFVSINNTNLAPGTYRVDLQDKNEAVVASVEYSINE